MDRGVWMVSEMSDFWEVLVGKMSDVGHFSRCVRCPKCPISEKFSLKNAIFGHFTLKEEGGKRQEGRMRDEG